VPGGICRTSRSRASAIKACFGLELAAEEGFGTLFFVVGIGGPEIWWVW
jgi:hypothetical protein